MYIGQVVGNLVSTKKADSLTGSRFLIVNEIKKQPDQGCIETGKQIVAIDTIGAGCGEFVLIVRGCSARKALLNNDCPVDAAIVGIVDDFIE